MSDLPIGLRLRVRVPVTELARLQVGSTLSLENAVLVSGVGAGHPLAGVRLQMRSDGSIAAHVVEPSATTMDSLLQNVGAGGAGSVRIASGAEAVVARSGYALFRPSAAAPQGSAHASARAALDSLVAGIARVIARAPEVFQDAEVRAAGPLDQLGGWVDALHALGRGEPAKVGKTRAFKTFDAWLDGFVEGWGDGALAVCATLLRRVREGRGHPKDGETAVNLLGLLGDVLPRVFTEEGVELVVCRPLETSYDSNTMRIVGRQPADGFDGRVVGQVRLGVVRGGRPVRLADVIVP